MPVPCLPDGLCPSGRISAPDTRDVRHVSALEAWRWWGDTFGGPSIADILRNTALFLLPGVSLQRDFAFYRTISLLLFVFCSSASIPLHCTSVTFLHDDDL
jgi:hypothetical protein